MKQMPIIYGIEKKMCENQSKLLEHRRHVEDSVGDCVALLLKVLGLKADENGKSGYCHSAHLL